MKILRRVLFIALIFSCGLLASCVTSETNGQSEAGAVEERPDEYWVGVAVAYAELCNTFFGNGPDPKVLQVVLNAYKNSEEFEKGYHRLSGYSASDGISGTGLNKCDEMTSALEKDYKKLK